jgi:SAM-dependent methyltransferase
MIKADGCFIPLPDNSFDAIYLLDVIEHVKDESKLIDEVLRILKVGGKLVLTTPHINIRLFPPFLTGWISKKWGHTLRRGYDPNQLRQFFDKKGWVTCYELNAKWYRNLYLLLKLSFLLSPKLTEKILVIIVNQESKKPYGRRGFVLLEVVKTLR